MWEKMEIIFKKNKIDYIIPRINGFGRTFFEYDNKWNNWVITIMEHMKFYKICMNKLIFRFSTGCNMVFIYHNLNGIVKLII